MNRSNSGTSHFDLRSSRLRYSSQRSSSQRQPSADSSSSLTSNPGSSAQSGILETLTSSGPAMYSSLRAPPCAEHLRLDPLAALDRQRQPRRLADQVALDGVLRLHIADPLLGPLLQSFGVFLGQDGHDRAGGHAVFEGVAP